MEISLFSILFFIYLAIRIKPAKIWRSRELFFFLIPIELNLELFINIGYLFKIGSLEISASDFLFVILVYIAVYIISKKRVKRKLLKLSISLIYSIIIGLIFLVVRPIDSGVISYAHNWDFDYFSSLFVPVSIKLVQIRMVLMIIAYIPILILVQNSYPENFKQKISDSVYRSLNIIYIILAIEFIIKNIIKSNIFSEIVLKIFGQSSSTVNRLLERGGTYGLQGLAREPSQLAKSIFLATAIFMLLSNNNIHKARKILLLSTIALVLARSLIGFASVLILISMYYIIFKKDRKILFYFFSIALILIIGKNINSIGYYIDRIRLVFEFLSSSQNKWIKYTEQVRMISIIETFRLFLKRPMFGIGYGITYAHSFIATGLVSMGIIGMIVWFRIHLYNRVLQIRHLIILVFVIIFWIINGYLGELYSISSLILILSIGKPRHELKIKYSADMGYLNNTLNDINI